MKTIKVLILGASGYLGESLYHKLNDLDMYEVLGSCYKSKSDAFININVLDEQDVQKVINMKPDIIVWTVMNQEHEYKISESGLKNILSSIHNDVRFIYLSTTVSRGRDQKESNQAIIRNENEYLHNYINGKILGEQLVKKLNDFTIIRPGSIYGFGYKNRKDQRMKVLKVKSDKCETFKRTKNLYASFVHIDDLCNSIIELLQSKFIGIVNIAGEKPATHYNFNKHIADMLRMNNDFIIPDYLDEENYHTLCSEIRKKIIKTKIREI